MKDIRLLMGMPITVEFSDPLASAADDIDAAFEYFAAIDERFSTYKDTSEVSRLNRGELAPSAYSDDLRKVLALCAQTTIETAGYFDIERDGYLDPSGIVKGWAVWNAAQLLRARGHRNFYVDAGGDVQVMGLREGRPWRVGIRNPFDRDQIVKVLALSDIGVATSGTAVRGQHVYDPHRPGEPLTEIVSITLIGPNVYEADRFATAAFAMGREGIAFVRDLPGFEGYMIDARGQATFTRGFGRYVVAA